MKELIISQIAPILITAAVSILTVIIKSIGDAVIELLAVKKKEVELRIISSGHEKELSTAKEVWHIIEEKFRITENAESLLGSKTDEFNKLLLHKIPGLTQTDLDYLRQAVAGELNKHKNIGTVQTTAIADNTTNSEKIANNDTPSEFDVKTNNINITAASNVAINDTITPTIPNVKADDKDITSVSSIKVIDKDLTASSNVTVDHPDDIRSIGATVNAINATVPN